MRFTQGVLQSVQHLFGPWVSSPWATGNGHATLLGPHVNGLGVPDCLWVHTNIHGRVETILNGLADERDLQDWVGTSLLTRVEEGVLSVHGLLLLVGVVWSGSLDLCKEVLLNIELTNVRNGSTLNGVVRQELSTVVDDC